MGKTVVYIVLLGVLGFGVYYLFGRNSDGLYSEKDANFTFRDTAAIGKIFLVENDGKSILVERGKSNQWMVNKKFPAMPVQVLNILTCLKMQSALKPVSALEHDRVVKMLAGLGVKVEVYDREGNKMRSFYVAGQGPNYHGSYMILENADQPYLVEIQGFEGYLTPRYTTDLNEWRSREVFALAPKDIRSISVKYPLEMLNSFTMDNSAAKPTVLLDPQLQPGFTDLNEKRVNDYLGFYTRVNSEGYLNGAESLDSIIKSSIPRATITVTPKTGKTTQLDVFWIELTDKEKDFSDQTSTDPAKRPKNVERMYAVNQSTHDTLLIQMLSFEKLFRRGYEFYQKDGQQQQREIPKGPFNTKKAPINILK